MDCGGGQCDVVFKCMNFGSVGVCGYSGKVWCDYFVVMILVIFRYLLEQFYLLLYQDISLMKVLFSVMLVLVLNIEVWVLLWKLVVMILFLVQFSMFFSVFLFCVFILVQILVQVVFFFSLMVRLIIDMFEVGMWKFMLVSFLFSFGIIMFMVLVVLVEDGMMFFRILWLLCQFLLDGLLMVFWVVVVVCMVVIRLCLMFYLLLIILVSGVRQLVVYEVLEMMVWLVQVLLLMLNMNIGVLFFDGVDMIIFFVLVLMCFCVVFLVRNRLVDLMIMFMFILFYFRLDGLCFWVRWIFLLLISRLLLDMVMLVLKWLCMELYFSM